MNVHTKLRAAAPLALLLAAGCVAGQHRETTIHREWPASEIKEIEVNEVTGSVHVRPGTSGKVLLTAHVVADGLDPAEAKNDSYFRAEADGSTLRLGRKHGRHFQIFMFDREDITIDYVLEVPPETALSVRTVTGSIDVEGVSGEANLTTVNGAVTATLDGSHEATLRTVNGSIRSKFTRDFHGAELKTVNGRVTTALPGNASFVCELSQVNGDFDSSFPFSIHSNPGSRRVSGAVNGGKYELHIGTVNGDVRIDNEGGAAPVSSTAAEAPPAAQQAPPAPPAAPAAPAREADDE